MTQYEIQLVDMLQVIEAIKNNPDHEHEQWLESSGLSEEVFEKAFDKCVEMGKIKFV